MNITILPFLLSLALSHRLYKFSKINQLNQWVKPLNYARYFTGFLFVVEIMLSASETTRWFWHLFMGGLLLFALQQKEMRSLRMYLLAFAPYVVIAFISDLTEIVLNDFYTRWENYFKNAGLLSVIWLIAILFSQHRQYKAAEKERIQRLQ